MNIVICGAGEVGRHAAEVLGADGSNITIIDHSAGKLAALEEGLDVRVMHGNGVHAEVLREAGVDKADLFLAATNIDEVNLLAAAVAKGVGARRVIARVHHSAYYENRGLDYAKTLGIDRLVCPEYTTAVAIAQMLRSPGVLAMERFARGRLEVQQLPVADNAPAIGKTLAALGLPTAARLASVERDGAAFIPDRSTEIKAKDVVTLIGEVDVFQKAFSLFDPSASRRKRVMVVGGTSMGVWLCRALRSRSFSVRLFEDDRERAEELAEKLDWVTVLRADAADSAIFDDERVDQVDAFVALTDHDEHNILAAARAKAMGAKLAVAVLQRSTYLHLLSHVGIDRAFSPRSTAVNELQLMLDESPVRHLASLAVGIADVYEVTLPNHQTDITGKPLKELKFPSNAMLAAIERDEEVWVPSATDRLEPSDTVILIGPADMTRKLEKYFGV